MQDETLKILFRSGCGFCTTKQCLYSFETLNSGQKEKIVAQLGHCTPCMTVLENHLIR